MRLPDQSDFFHLTVAATRAISVRCSGESFALLAAAPLGPPARPLATAAGSFFVSSRSSVWPVAMSPINLASAIGSRGRGSRVAVMT